MIVSDKLALGLYKFEELPKRRQEDIIFNENNPNYVPSKGDNFFYKTSNDFYLVISPEQFPKSLLTRLYGNRIYRVNDDSFDTLLYKILVKLDCFRKKVSGNSKFSKQELVKLVVGFDKILDSWDNDIWKFYHWLIFIDDFLDIKFDNSLLKTLKFFNIMELLIFNKAKSNQVNCIEKLPKYLLGTMPEMMQIWPFYLSKKYKPIQDNSTKICEKIAIIRNKVVHNEFQIVIQTLNDLFNSLSLTEDVESNGVFDQIRNFNMILDGIIVNIFESLIDNPNEIINLHKN